MSACRCCGQPSIVDAVSAVAWARAALDVTRGRLASAKPEARSAILLEVERREAVAREAERELAALVGSR